METQKAIKLIKNYLLNYCLYDRLNSIGFDPDVYGINYTELGCLIFDIDENVEFIDEVGENFYNHADKLIQTHNDKSNFHHKIPDDLLTSTAINVYSDWKALKLQRQTC